MTGRRQRRRGPGGGRRPHLRVPTLLAAAAVGLACFVVPAEAARRSGPPAGTDRAAALTAQAEALATVLERERARLAERRAALLQRIDQLVRALAAPPPEPATAAQRRRIAVLQRLLQERSGTAEPSGDAVGADTDHRAVLSGFLQAAHKGAAAKPPVLPAAGLIPEILPARTRTHLHFRAGPGTDHPVRRTLPPDTPVLVVGRVPGSVWRLTWHEDDTGYLSILWLRTE